MKNHTNIFWFMIDTKPLRVMFDKLDGFIRVHSGTKYLVLFGLEKYNPIFDRIRYLIRITSRINRCFLIIMQKSNFIQMMICL